MTARERTGAERPVSRVTAVVSATSSLASATSSVGVRDPGRKDTGPPT